MSHTWRTPLPSNIARLVWHLMQGRSTYLKDFDNTCCGASGDWVSATWSHRLISNRKFKTNSLPWSRWTFISWEVIRFEDIVLVNNMMTSSNGNIFQVTGPLCGESQWIPLTKASDAELWCLLWSAPWINGWVNNGEAGDLRRHCNEEFSKPNCDLLSNQIDTYIGMYHFYCKMTSWHGNAFRITGHLSRNLTNAWMFVPKKEQ